jgi:hypothetical protein
MPARNGSTGAPDPRYLWSLVRFLVLVAAAVLVLGVPWIRADAERPIYFISILLFGMSAVGLRLPVSVSSLGSFVRGLATRKPKEH